MTKFPNRTMFETHNERMRLLALLDAAKTIKQPRKQSFKKSKNEKSLENVLSQMVQEEFGLRKRSKTVRSVPEAKPVKTKSARAKAGDMFEISYDNYYGDGNSLVLPVKLLKKTKKSGWDAVTMMGYELKDEGGWVERQVIGDINLRASYCKKMLSAPDCCMAQQVEL